MNNRFLIELSYKGTQYQGWQIQKNTSNTIQRIVNEKLSVVLRDEITVTAAGRTDAGVHAKQNYVHFDTSKNIPKDLIRRLNFLLPPDIAVSAIYTVDKDFNARFDAISRSYEYLFCYNKNPFWADISCYYPYQKLSLKKLNEAARLIKSQTDFASFSKRRTQVKTTVCAIKHAHWELDEEQNILRFSITADRFLRGMVRGIVATSIRYARDKMTMDDLNRLMHSKKPHKTDFSAPAQGLTLIAVKYPEKLLPEKKYAQST